MEHETPTALNGQLAQEREGIQKMVQILGRCPFFRGVREVSALMYALASHPETHWVDKEPEQAFYEKTQAVQHMHFLVRGLAAVSTDKGLIALRHPGQQMALTLLLSEAGAESNCRALVPCRALAVSKAAMELAFQVAPQLAVNMAKCHAERSRVFQFRLDLLSTRDHQTSARITRAFFVQLDNALRKHRIFWSSDDPIELKLKREEVAKLLGFSEGHFRKNLLAPLLEERLDGLPLLEWSSATGSLIIHPAFQTHYHASYPSEGFGEF